MGILSEHFVQKEDYMVAPPQFADPASDYTGYRAGIRRVERKLEICLLRQRVSGGTRRRVAPGRQAGASYQITCHSSLVTHHFSSAPAAVRFR